MRRLIAVVSVALVASVGLAEDSLMEISWTRMKSEGKVGAGEILPPDSEAPFEHLKIVGIQPQGPNITILTLDKPGITAATYAITGQVRCEGVEGKAYLEMWNYFADGSRLFSRTLGTHGPMKYLGGSSGWRRFVLPFFLQDNPARPQKLVVNVVLPGPGTVLLGDLRVMQYAPGEDPLATAGQWWGDRTGGLVGAILGSVVGCFGALIGVLVHKGKARRFVMGVMKAMIVVGITLLLLGVVALAQSQPYGVYYPLLLAGALCAVLPAGLLRGVRKRYEQLELRKMEARDAV